MSGQESDFKGLLRNRNFMLLWGGEAVSLIGDQFLIIALPWLVLQLTGDPLATGGVLAVMAIPRALFMLLGGALTDRFSPHRVMLVSTLFRLVLVLWLGLVVVNGPPSMALILTFAVLNGLSGAFFFPAQHAIVPQLVEKKHLQLSNTVIQGTFQVSQALGPALAGALIATLSASGVESDVRGIGLAVLLDAVTFAISVATLWLMRVGAFGVPGEEAKKATMLESIRDGLAFVWKHLSLRVIFIMIALANFLIVGPMSVGIPVLADTRLPGGAAAFGTIMSSFGIGSLLGLVIVGLLPQPHEERLGTVLTVVWSVMGLCIAAMGLISVTWTLAAIALVMGAANSYVTVLFITWLQIHTPEKIMGRMMSVLMFASMGLQPLALAAAGAVSRVSLTGLFVGSGLLMSIMVLVMILPNPEVRRMAPPVAETSI